MTEFKFSWHSPREQIAQKEELLCISWFFSERSYYHVPEEEIIKNASYFGIPNAHFDPVKGGELYNAHFDEAVYAEKVGFDGVMLNEHHGTPFCMGSVMNVEAAVLARITERLKIVSAGQPPPRNRPSQAGRRASNDRHDFGWPFGARLGARCRQ